MDVDVNRWRRTYVAVMGRLDRAEGILSRSVGPQRSMQARLPWIVHWTAVVPGGVGVIQKHLHSGYRFAVQVDDGPT